MQAIKTISSPNYHNQSNNLSNMEEPTEEKISVCRLCLRIKNKNNCEPFQQGFFVDLLEQLSLKVDLLNVADPVICDNCIVKLQQSTEFKILCDEAKNRSSNVYDALMANCCICKTAKTSNCMQDSITKMYSDILLKKYITSLDFLNKNEMYVCQVCFDHLQKLDDLVVTSEETERKLRNYIMKNGISNISLNLCEILPYLLESSYNIDGSNNTTDIAVTVNVENDAKPELIESVDRIFRPEVLQPKKKLNKTINPRKNTKKPKKEPEGVMMYKTDQGELKYKCIKCSYENRYKWQVIRHFIIHKNITEVEHFKCNECNFVTKYKASLIVHDLVHRSTEEIPMYKCPLCDYQAKIKRNVLNHSIVHKNMDEIPIYECDECPFYTKFKPSLTKHKLTHKDIMDGPMFQCAECIYVTKFKKNLKKHMFVHKDPTDVKMYKCDECNFSTKFPYSLKKHTVIHKDPSEVDMFKCSLCSYQTKFKYSLFRHNLIHKSPSEVMMFQCDHCPYQTKLKANLESHRLRHQRTQEDGMYKCEYCSYQCKFKHAITAHTALHMN